MIFPALLQGWGREEGTGLGQKASCGEKAGNKRRPQQPENSGRGQAVPDAVPDAFHTLAPESSHPFCRGNRLLVSPFTDKALKARVVK